MRICCSSMTRRRSSDDLVGPEVIVRNCRLVKNGMSLFVTDETASVRYCAFQDANSFVQNDRTTSSETLRTAESRYALSVRRRSMSSSVPFCSTATKTAYRSRFSSLGPHES